MIHCVYGIYHLWRPASGRTPASSGAYQLFSGFSDLCVMPLYAFGALATQNSGKEWTTRLPDQHIIAVFVPALYYTLITAAGLHFISLTISLWLGLMFRKITHMPPDMNPLEDNLTSRARHKKNKSSVVTTSTDNSEKQPSTPLEAHRRSGLPYEDTSRPPTVPFMHTRNGSYLSVSTRDSRVDLPSRQYQITPGNSPRNSVVSNDIKRLSAPRLGNRASYTEIPLYETRKSNSMSDSGSSPEKPRGVGKFTETWSTTDSLVSRTQQRNRALNAAAATQSRTSKVYEAVPQRYNFNESSDTESEADENDLAGSDFETEPGISTHPNPLGSHPPRTQTPYYPNQNPALTEVSLNQRRASGTNDIADEKPHSWAGKPWRNRISSIQPESAFFSKPYGELKPATPPVIIGSNRQVSSGNDYETSYSSAFGRRNVSGKAAEEGRAGGKSGYSRHGILGR
jgi:hypothetical protein